MALVCDLQSSPNKDDPIDPDLEDGEIEDDEEAAQAEPQPEAPPEEPQEAPVAAPVTPEAPQAPRPLQVVPEIAPRPDNPEFKGKKKFADKQHRHEDKKDKYRHMTEAEKSILHLRKREKMMREKWEKQYKREMRINDPMEDDFAKNIEKTLATILSKKEKEAAAANAPVSGEETYDKEEEKRPKKKKKHNKDHKKHHHGDSPRSDYEENDNYGMNDSPGMSYQGDRRSHSPTNSEETAESDYTADIYLPKEEEKVKKKKKKQKKRKRAREQVEKVMQDSQGVCIFYLQGKCQKNDCPYSHEANPPMKLELCKFYLMGCCAKGEKCSYMHSEFPCKFYHTGLHCNAGDDCKFAHGKPLSEGLKQILFKHIETAPRDILGGFPRITREDALNMINVTQRKLIEQFGPTLQTAGEETREENQKTVAAAFFERSVPMPPELRGIEAPPPKRSKPSRWQDPDPAPQFPIKFYGHDQDMRINSNGDIDMRTIPIVPPILPSSGISLSSTVSESSQEPAEPHIENKQESVSGDVDIRSSAFIGSEARSEYVLPGVGKDVDIRSAFPDFGGEKKDVEENKEYSNMFEKSNDNSNDSEQDKFDIGNIDWYSDDDDDEDRLTIKVEEDEKVRQEDEEDKEEKEDASVRHADLSPPPIKPLDVMSKLGDLSKIDISAEVTRLLTSMSQNRTFPNTTDTKQESDIQQATTSTAPVINDPRTSRQDPRLAPPSINVSPRQDPRLVQSDPRNRSRQSSTDSQEKEKKPEKISIYDQGSFDIKDDIEDFTKLRPDIDLRNLTLPFKGMENYTPAKEIDASINSHLPMPWTVILVEIPRPDYTGLKLSINDAEKTGDPRLRKIFRLSTEEKDSPMSPKESPRQSSTPRVDPRLRKTEEKPTLVSEPLMNFSQQLNMLQSSAFYQSLTTNQKMMLNQELSRSESAGAHNPVLDSLLTNLNLIPNAANIQNNPNIGTALGILANVAKLNPMINPGILGAAPGIPNLNPEFPMNFDPRNGGLLGNAPQPYGGNNMNFPQDQGYQQYGGNDYYPEGNFQHRDNRGFNRDRRRGRNNFNKNQGNRNFRNNRNNHNNHRQNRNHPSP